MSATILIVDDSKMVRAMVRGALEKESHQVFEACDGKDALGVLASVNPDLIVTDINMPEMDGLSLIQALRELPAHQCTPIMVLSNEAGDEVRNSARRVGATGWLDKPFHPEQLCQLARYALELRKKALRKQGNATS
jgi:two-component system chemotaxis response regulator CheY